MKTLTTTLLLLAALSLSASPKPCIGYWIVTYDTENGYKPTGTTEILDVYVIAEQYFPGNCIDFDKQLKESVFFKFESDSKVFYVEVRKVKHNGKFKRLSKKEVNEYRDGHNA
jgi:hypothetical protein